MPLVPQTHHTCVRVRAYSRPAHGVNSLCYEPVTIVQGGNKLFLGENEIYKKCVENWNVA